MALTQESRELWAQFVGGTGLRNTKYPVNAAGVSLTASGLTTGAYKFAAAGANVKSVVAKATVTTNFKIVGLCLNTFSATSIFVVRLGYSTAAAVAIATIAAEVVVNEITAAGVVPFMLLPATATQVADGTNDLIAGDAASSNAAADDTVVVSVTVQTGIGVA